MDLRNKVTDILVEAKASIIAAMAEEVKNNGGYIDLEDSFSYEDDEGRKVTPLEMYLGTDDDGEGDDTLRIVSEYDNGDNDEVAHVYSIEELDTICDILLMNINK